MAELHENVNWGGDPKWVNKHKPEISVTRKIFTDSSLVIEKQFKILYGLSVFFRCNPESLSTSPLACHLAPAPHHPQDPPEVADKSWPLLEDLKGHPTWAGVWACLSCSNWAPCHQTPWQDFWWCSSRSRSGISPNKRLNVFCQVCSWSLERASNVFCWTKMSSDNVSPSIYKYSSESDIRSLLLVSTCMCVFGKVCASVWALHVCMCATSQGSHWDELFRESLLYLVTVDWPQAWNCSSPDVTRVWETTLLHQTITYNVWCACTLLSTLTPYFPQLALVQTMSPPLAARVPPK